MPEDWESLPNDEPVFVNDELIGNHKYGDSIAIHSVAISPDYQGKRVGRALVSAYTQHLKRGSFGASRAVLIAHDYLVNFYESVGFKNQGLSKSSFAGGVWYDMVCLFFLFLLFGFIGYLILIHLPRHMSFEHRLWYDCFCELREANLRKEKNATQK